MATYGMKQLEERHVPTTVLKMEWSNKMDLLAIAKEHGEQLKHHSSDEPSLY